MHSSSAVAAARAHLWASLASVSSHSPEVSHLPLWEAWSQWQEGWVLAGSGSPPPPNSSPLLCLRQSKEDTMSFVISRALSGPQSGGLGNLLSTYTGQWRSPISSLNIQYPTSWIADTSAPESSFGRPCQQPWQINLSASFHLDSAACTNIHWRMNGQCCPPTSHCRYLPRNNPASR